MPDEKDRVPVTLETIAEKVDALSKSVDTRFEQVDARFGQVDARFAQIDERFAQADERFEKFARSVDERFVQVTAALVEQREYTEFAFGRVETQLKGVRVEMTNGFSRLDRKLDQLIARPSRKARRGRT